MGFKPEDVRMMENRLARKSGPVGGQVVGVDAGQEVEELHNPTLDWLKGRGLPYVYNRPDKASTATPGAPDFTIGISRGAVVFIEFKTREGKLSEKQVEWHFLARRAGIEVHVLRSMESFFELMSTLGVE